MDCRAIPIHDPRPMMLQHIYGLIIQAQGRHETLTDKVIALAFRENGIKNRDLGDIAWLVPQGVTLPASLIPAKIADHQRTQTDFRERLRERFESLKADAVMRDDFLKERQRFLPAAAVRETMTQSVWWNYLMTVLEDQARMAEAAL